MHKKPMRKTSGGAQTQAMGNENKIESRGGTAPISPQKEPEGCQDACTALTGNAAKTFSSSTWDAQISLSGKNVFNHSKKNLRYFLWTR